MPAKPKKGSRSRSAQKQRPKSAKQASAFRTLKPPTATAAAKKANNFQVYTGGAAKSSKKQGQAASGKAAGGKKRKAVRKQQPAGYYPEQQGVLMNNFFPALEGGLHGPGDEVAAHKDSRYPKFGLESLAVHHPHPNMIVEDQIDEVPQEQEEAESHGEAARGFYGGSGSKAAAPHQESEQVDEEAPEGDQDEADPQQQRQQDEEEGEDTPGKPSDGMALELSDDQLIELIKNAHALSPEQQLQLQLIL